MKKLSGILILVLVWLSQSAFIPRLGRHIVETDPRVSLGMSLSYDAAISRKLGMSSVGSSLNQAYRHFGTDLSATFGESFGKLESGFNLSSFWYMSNFDLFYHFLNVGVLNLGAGAEIGLAQAPYLLGSLSLGNLYLSLKPRFMVYFLGSNWDNGFDDEGMKAFNSVVSFGWKSILSKFEGSLFFGYTRHFGSGFEWFNYSDVYGSHFYKGQERLPYYNSISMGASFGVSF